MAKITGTTVHVEDFISAPKSELRKLNLFAKAIRELQKIVRQIITALNQQGAPKTFTINNNGYPGTVVLPVVSGPSNL